MTESELQQHVQIEARKYNCFLMRNNSGAFKDEGGRLVRYGLGNISPAQPTLSSDLVGFQVVTITPDMVGQQIAVIAATEIKKPGWTKPTNDREKKQAKWLEWIRAHGGKADFINSIDSIQKLLGS